MPNQPADEIKPDPLISLAQDLIRIPSTVKGIDQGHEQEIANYITTRLQASGFTVELQVPREGRPNVIATLKGTGGGRSLMLNGHLDTVETEGMAIEPFAGRVENGRLYGRGAVDMKSALAAFIHVGETLNRLGIQLQGDLIISGCMDEEGRAIGSQTMARSLPSIDGAIVGEPTGMKIGVAHKGLTFITLHTYGKATHGSTPELGTNAIMAMVRILHALETELPRRFEEKRHPALGAPTYNVGVISGGYRPNVVPDRCEVEIDRRMVPGETLSSVLEEIEDVLATLRSKDRSLKADAVALDWAKTLPMEVSPDEHIVRSVSEGLRKIGQNPETATVPYWTDASSFTNISRIPTVVFGPGGIAEAHSATEHIEISELVNYARAIAHIVIDFCNSEKPK